MRKRRVVGRIYWMKYSWKGHKDKNRHKSRIKRSGQARLVYVKKTNRNIPTTWRWAHEETPDFGTNIWHLAQGETRNCSTNNWRSAQEEIHEFSTSLYIYFFLFFSIWTLRRRLTRFEPALHLFGHSLVLTWYIRNHRQFGEITPSVICFRILERTW